MAALQDADVAPDCRSENRLNDDNEWVEKPPTERLQAWYDPCKRCFPDGEIVTEMIVKKQSRSGTRPVLHRPQ